MSDGMGNPRILQFRTYNTHRFFFHSQLDTDIHTAHTCILHEHISTCHEQVVVDPGTIQAAFHACVAMALSAGQIVDKAAILLK